MDIVGRLFKVASELHWKFLSSGTRLRCEKGGTVRIDPSVHIGNSRIYVTSGSTLIIGAGSNLDHVSLYVDGHCEVGPGNIIHGNPLQRLELGIRGRLIIGERNLISCRIIVRFGGQVSIASFTNINDDTEIRADESVTIGSFNQISYQCLIWDTNTHNIYPNEQRRELTRKHFPVFGYEFERPLTRPVVIGDDCWIGREAAILKGVTIGNSVVVGFRALLHGCKIPEKSTVVSKSELRIIPR